MNGMKRVSLGIALFIWTAGCSSDWQPPVGQEADRREAPALAVQLWSVRTDLAEDFEGTLQQLANIGYQGVEFAWDYGTYAGNPSGLRELLAANNLQCAGSHIGADALSDDQATDTLEYHAALGCNLLIIAGDSRAHDPEQIVTFAEALDRMAERAAAYGIAVGYHNHDKELAVYDGQTLLETLSDATTKSVFLQLDVGWVIAGGADPTSMVSRIGDRLLSTHFKSGMDKANGTHVPAVGLDGYDWTTLTRRVLDQGATQWIVLEQEKAVPDMTSMEVMAAAHRAIEAIITDFGKGGDQ